MSKDARTVQCAYVFKVSETGSGQTWISLEPVNPPPAELANFLIGFDLPERTPIAKAREIAAFLNGNLGDLTLTIFNS